VTVHGISITAWFVLFFAQSLLIVVRSRKVHMTLGWSAIVIGIAIAGSGTLVAIRSVQLTPGLCSSTWNIRDSFWRCLWRW
jgi:hypothetical protein